jgi:hypothetical protein
VSNFVFSFSPQTNTYIHEYKLIIERQCESEAAAFYVAYALGLPCFAFQPNALEAAIMMFESMKEHSAGDGVGAMTPIQKLYSATSIDPLLSDAGLLKILIWLMAPVAMEQQKHPQLIASDPKEASGLLQRIQQKASVMGVDPAVIDNLVGLSMSNAKDNDNNADNVEQQQVLLKWAYAEANTLLRQNSKAVQDVSERLAGGTATVGDCVAAIEGW